jgi:hypothetical protein
MLQQVVLHLDTMKTVVLWAFLLCTVRCADYSDVFICAANPINIKFTLKSYRNQTGHWKAQGSKHIYILA